MSSRTKGILFGIFVGIAWGLDGVLMGQVNKIDFLSSWEVASKLGISEMSFNYSSLVSGFFHESFCFMWVALVLLFSKQLKQVFKLLLTTKKGKAAAVAALVGSPIGMSAYLLGIKYATAPYASGISVVYPGIGAILSYLVLKEKLKPRAMVGIAISLIGSCMLVFDPSGVQALNFPLGVMFAVIAVLGWASEGVIIGFAMKHIKDEDHVEATPQQFLCLRYLVSMLAYSIIVIPSIGGYPLVHQVVASGLVYKYAGIAILGALTYLSWYKAVDLIGAAMGTALNSTATLWVIIFGALLFNVPVTPSIVIWGLVIVTGVFIFAIDIAINKGILFGIFVGIAWGLDGVLMGEVNKIDFLSSWEVASKLGISEISFNYSSLVSGFFHESFCFMWVALVLLFSKQLKQVFKLLLTTKKGKAAAVAALVGSPIGMSAYLLGIKYATTPYASGISVVYPGIGAILSYLVLKEKLKPRAMVGIAISLVGSCMLAITPSEVQAENFPLGIMFAIVAVLGWASEGVIIGFAMKHIKDEDHIQATPQQFLCLRYFVSMLAYSIVVIPAIKGYPLVHQVVESGLVYKYAGIAILGALTYLSWYKAVDLIGAAMGTALNSTATLWVIIFGALLFGVAVTPATVIWGLVIVTGVFIFAIEPTNKK